MYRNKNKYLPGYVEVSELVESVIDPLCQKKGNLGRIISSWSDIVGGDISNKSTPRKITFRKGEKQGGTLHIDVNDCSALEISHMTGLIVEKISIFFGYQLVSDIAIKQRPFDDKVISQNIEGFKKKVASHKDIDRIESCVVNVKDDVLQKALRDLGKNIN